MIGGIMKKIWGIIFTLTLMATLIGCSNTPQSVSSNPDSSQSPQQLVEKKFTEEDALSIFKIHNDLRNDAITDSILVNDAKMPMLRAVISYADKMGNSNNLSFILEDSSQEICFAANEVEGVNTYAIDENSQLNYIGNGTVTTSIRNIATNEIINYTVTFSYEESTSITNFKIVAGE